VQIIILLSNKFLRDLHRRAGNWTPSQGGDSP
jgi:hypothetical protein